MAEKHLKIQLSKGKNLPRKGLIKSCHGKGMRKQRPQVRKRA